MRLHMKIFIQKSHFQNCSTRILRSFFIGAYLFREPILWPNRNRPNDVYGHWPFSRVKLRNELNANQGENVRLPSACYQTAELVRLQWRCSGFGSNSLSLVHSIVIWLAFSLCASVHRFLNSTARILMKIWSNAAALVAGEKTEAAVPLPDKNVCVFGEQRVENIRTAPRLRRRAAVSYCKWIAAKWCTQHNTQRIMLTHPPAVCFCTLDLCSEAMHLPMFCFNYMLNCRLEFINESSKLEVRSASK
jgi:hypothetical protein